MKRKAKKQRNPENVFERIVRRNNALWRMLNDRLPKSERLAALNEALGE